MVLLEFRNRLFLNKGLRKDDLEDLDFELDLGG